MTPRDRQCEGKRKYLSEAEAELQARALKKRKKQRVGVYACCYCSVPGGVTYWHVGGRRSPEAAMRREGRIG
jgi:hypothetical protein